MKRRAGFTLIEVLIAVLIVGFLVPALYRVLDLLYDMNNQVKTHLDRNAKAAEVMRTLYLDVAESDGNLTLHKDTFDRLCIERTVHSIYEKGAVRVCWVVGKRKHTLFRIEGKSFTLPLGREDEVMIDPMLVETTLFDLYHKQDTFIAYLRAKEDTAPHMFALNHIKKKPPKKTMTKKPPVPPGTSAPLSRDR